MQVAVDVEPASVGIAFEAARLVQAVRTAVQPAARDELDAGVVGVASVGVGLLMLAVLLDSFKKDKTAEPKADEDGAA